MRGRLFKTRGRRAASSGVCTLALLFLAAGCGGEKRPPTQDEADTIAGSVAGIVYQCRAVEQGFQSTVVEETLRRDVDALVEVADEVDPDATFRLPEPAIEPETTLRDQARLAARLLGEDCSPEDAERLQEAIGD